jgi:hypothetical protein
MVFNTQNYWGVGLFPSSNMVENRKHDVSETGSVSVLKCLHLLFSRIPDKGNVQKPSNSAHLFRSNKMRIVLKWVFLKEVKYGLH